MPDRIRTSIRAMAAVAGGALVLGVAGAAPAHAASPCTAAPAKRTFAYRSVSGVPANLTSLDVYSPSKDCLKGHAAPVVLWVHGGAYRVGDKSQQVRDKIALFASRRYVFVSINYRLTTSGPLSARYPDHFRDVASAVAWVRKNISRYRGDGRRLALLGHSAGADIVSNVATNPQWLKERSLPLSALRCSAPLDTEGFNKPEAEAAEQQQWVAALGNNPDFLRGTSATLLAKPKLGLRPVITVVRGTARRQRIEQGFADAYRAAGVKATVIDARGLTHQEVNTRIGAAGDRVMTPPLLSFLKTCFAAR